MDQQSKTKEFHRKITSTDKKGKLHAKDKSH